VDAITHAGIVANADAYGITVTHAGGVAFADSGIVTASGLFRS
jgi:hypothetical protein